MSTSKQGRLLAISYCLFNTLAHFTARGNFSSYRHQMTRPAVLTRKLLDTHFYTDWPVKVKWRKGCIYSPSMFDLCKLCTVCCCCFALLLLQLCSSFVGSVLRLCLLCLQIIFVLRKKERQISFLHVYHHTTQVTFVWAYLKYLPGKSL